MDPILRQLNTDKSLITYVQRLIVMFSSHLYEGTLSMLFPSGLQMKMLCIFLLPMNATCSTNITPLAFITLIVCGELYIVTSHHIALKYNQSVPRQFHVNTK